MSDLFEETDPINPDYYKVGGYELTKVLRAYGLHHFAFRFNAVQYLMRAHMKHGETIEAGALEIRDLEKAKWYLDEEISRMKGLMIEGDR